MARRRFVYLVPVVILALSAGLFTSQRGSDAVDFRPSTPGVALSNTTLNASVDVATRFDLGLGQDNLPNTADDTPDSNFGGGGTIAFADSAFTLTRATVGRTVGYLRSDATLGVLSSGCLTPVQVPFQFLEASIDTGTSFPPAGPSDNRLINYIQDDGDMNNVDDDANGATPADSDGGPDFTQATAMDLDPGAPGFQDGIPDGAQVYPSFLNDIFAGAGTPVARYFAAQLVPGTSLWVTLNLVTFSAGAFTGLPSIPSSELLTANLGRPTAVVLSDTTAAPSNNAVTDFCAALGTGTLLCGTTDANIDTPATLFQNLSCDVASTSTCTGDATAPGCEVRFQNPAAGGTYAFRTMAMSGRDTDGDGIENAADTCPLTTDAGWDPRVLNSVNNTAANNFTDNDEDGIPNSCDTFNGGQTPCFDLLDEDCDGWLNRLDNCPSVVNGSEPMTTPNDKQNDRDISSLATAVPDGGPRADGIGPECETIGDRFTPSGHYHQAMIINRVCLGVGASETDADGDGVCASYPGENDSNVDTDGDNGTGEMGSAVANCVDGSDNDGDGRTDTDDTECKTIDTNDNCIGVANPNPNTPSILSPYSPDINNNGVVQIDDIVFVSGKFGLTVGLAGYRAAAELGVQNSVIQIDDVVGAAGAFGANC